MVKLETVTIAVSVGLAGLELAKQELPDLILCDVSMPGLNGHEVLERNLIVWMGL